MSLEAFFVSTGVVALAEIGDKTQLLALVLACRYRAPLTILAGILAATLLNHAIAGFIGQWLSGWFDSGWGRWALAAGFFAMAAWALIPDKLEEGEQRPSRFTGAFLATLVAFFIVEIGDKTQVATVMLAAKYASLTTVVIGTTLGMMLANAPVVLLADKFANRLPLNLIRIVVAISFAVLGVLLLIGV
jgi:Ca2+/H+ antiporter, TMEM165/GDT1 family